MSTRSLGASQQLEYITQVTRDTVPFVDIHCHCLPAIDDGPADLDAALALCRALAADGIGTVVATPHQLGPYEGRTHAAAIAQAAQSLQDELRRHEIPLQLLPGADVRLHEQLIELIANGEVMTLAGRRRWLLLEMPQSPFINIGQLLKDLAAGGIGVVFSHPERYPWIRRHLSEVLAWRAESGIRLQVTAASLLGDFGKQVAEFTWQLASLQAIDLVASDAHSAQGLRRPRVTAAAELVRQKLGAEIVQQWFVDGPAALLADAPL